MPPGFEFTESINGVVSVGRTGRAAGLIPAVDLDLVRTEISPHRHLRYHAVEARGNEIIVYEPDDRLSDKGIEMLAELSGGGPVLDRRVADIKAETRYWPVMKFVSAGFGLPDNYVAFRMSYRGAGGWRQLSARPLGTLVKAYVRHIGTEKFLRAAMSARSAMTHRFTPTQGQYLAFIQHYTVLHGRAPAEADMQRYFRTSPPAVHQMVLALEKRGLITRTPGQARSVALCVAADELPRLGEAGAARARESPADTTGPASYLDTVTRTACAVITKLFEQCEVYPIDDAEFLPLIGGIATVVEQELRGAGLASADAAAATRRVEDFAVAIYVDLCARNDPDGADARADAATCRRLMACRRTARRS